MGLFSDILKEIPTTGVLREHILLLQEKMNGLFEEVINLKEECAQLKEQKRELTIELKKLRAQEEFVEHRGALFKRKPGGGYHLGVYCPVCHVSTYSVQNDFPFGCDRCNWNAQFTGHELEAILEELPE